MRFSTFDGAYRNRGKITILALQYNFMHVRDSQQGMDASMNDGAWRLDRYLSRTLLTGLIALPFAARAQVAAEFAAYYRNAYVQGRDLIPGRQTPIDFSSIATRLELQAVSPGAALSGNAFLAADSAVIKLAAAAKAKTDVWANARFVHPYGERYRTNPKTN